ncbi:uncharacterized protein LOC115332158 [Ixodes scapularis]|uniref:uncharacterized protein LOC115332158 n=1 Tax=Ixodes scapularis TaxID=6945 RepID=UPI001A9D4B64|nr:uncharacterized protein LOC115332158 [Ixodes scapularis]
MAAPEASISLEAATSAVAKHVQGDSDTQEIKSILPNSGPGWGSSSDNSLTQVVTIKTDVQGDSDTQEIKSILPNSGPGWGSSSDNSLTQAVTIKTDVQGDSDTQESESILPDDGPGWDSSSDNSLTQAVTVKTEPQVSEETLGQHSTAVAVKIEPPDPTEVRTEAVSTGTGLDGSSGNTAMTAVTIKTEPPEYVEQDKEPGSNLVSVKSEPEWYEEVWEPGNPVPALTKGEAPDYTDVTKVTFHTNPEPQVSEGAQQCGNAMVAVKTGLLSQCHFTARCDSECWNHLLCAEPQDPTEADALAISSGAGM